MKGNIHEEALKIVTQTIGTPKKAMCFLMLVTFVNILTMLVLHLLLV